ncbi:Rrf2 family transcriptional regulator [Martelella mediterranea]|uniref:RrF2 family transcriptional regulator n=1 Tax=Martelella mediterranea TaxID=293089 RepID=UPI001E37AB30|nr:Rrf2 family transcriptional regulator [Martelella mediterranea]MCD1633904.1 Rrf2 family transcriptional regulator [Martelella mediterranea]
MRQDSRLPRVLHALLHLERMRTPATSELIARMLGTNASVVRRTMAGLRQAGIVVSVKGHGGGWSLARPLTEISLLDIYQALDAPALFAIGIDDGQTTCLLARAANDATANALLKAQQHFEAHLRSVSVADLALNFEQSRTGHKGND